jgi:hypothetical protein
MGVPATVDSWLARCISAYRVGHREPVTMSDGPSGELFRARGQSHIRSRLADGPYDHYVAVRDRARAAVTAARAGDFDGSERQFAEAEALLSSLALSGEPQQLSRSWIDQAYAYLAVRKRDWQAARDRLTSAMQADLALEDEFGYDIFHIGRVHTLHLWLRAEGEAGRRIDAVRLAQDIVDYVHGRRDALPIGGGWSRERAAAVPDDLKLAMTLRLSSEAGTQIALCRPEDAPAAFAEFTAWKLWADHPVLSEVHEWAQAKAACLAGDTRMFLERAEAFLKKGRRETTLWYAIALDLCRVCAAVRPDATRPFRDDVQADAAAWRHLPADVQSPGLFAVMSREPGADPGHGYRPRPSLRRCHVLTTGLPRTGSTSLYTLFTNFRAGNEFMERETITRVVQHHTGAASRAELEDYLRRRHREGDLEMDSASFHHLYLDFLLNEFPGARFIMTIRSPYDWANSYIKMIAGWRRRFVDDGEPLPQWMEDYGVMLFGNFSWDWVASPGAIAERAEPLADAFIRHWADANRRTLSLLPRERSLIVRTEELSQSCARIADFAGVPAAALTDQHHSNSHPDRSDLLAGLGRGWVEARAREYGADVFAAAGIELETVAAYPERAAASRRA